ncbi:MAG: putative DNA binding domain-containing protein [Planctomycetaceae bacterium]|nr:putative DNA binding domain-containing protein [Planctomycetaceae bacterium]
MTAQELFNQLNQLDEHVRVEAKRASEVGASVLETVCSLSNEPGLGGGWILLGVAKKGGVLFPGFGTYEVVGVDDPDKVSADLASKCASEFNQMIRPKIEPATINNKTVLSVFVPELPDSQKPVFLKKRGLPRGAYRRIGSSDQHCTEDDLTTFYQSRQGETFDGGIVSGANLTHIDPAAVREYRKSRAEINPDAEELRWDDAELMEALGAAKVSDGGLTPTVAGILLFGTSAALRRFFPMTRVDYIRVPGREWVKDPDHRFDTVEIRSPLIRAVRRAFSAVFDDLPKAFALPPGQVERTDDPAIPSRVIREAIVNAVMHRSYRVSGPIQIIRYQNRLEIRNPGHSLKSEDRLGDPGSILRNPLVAAALHETNLAETKGSGIRVMRELMDQVGLTPPTFESDRDGDQFIVTMLFHHFLSPEDWEWLRRFSEHALSDEEARALVFVRETGAINNLAYRDLNKVDTLNASSHLRRLRDRGLLEMRGKGAETYYVPTHDLLLGWPASTHGNSGNLAGKSGNLTGKSGNLAGKSGNLTESERQGNSLLADLSEEIASIGRKTDKDTLMGLICKVCARNEMSTSELANLFRKTRQHMLDFYLTPLVHEGRLVMTIPDTPHHPEQKYRASDLI